MENEQQLSASNEQQHVTINKRSLFVAAYHRIPKKIILFFISIAAIVLFFLLPANKEWYTTKVIGYWNDFRVQKKKLSIEERMKSRFGSQYTYSKYITDLFEKKGNRKDVLVLIPSEKFFKQHGYTYPVPEPVTFYYLTGLKTVWVKDAKATAANWYVSVREGNMIIDSVLNAAALKDTIVAFNNY